ncbi:4'-phosphopantetheinyl transferase family protein [Streptomyces sp. NPDC051569]|uniref:4'-phosphopantetheinyl transferase family protein n=1 Tax=Streptomyces sp. NPDC051569 TaxID=3365661 RepID=UPI0037AE3DAC
MLDLARLDESAPGLLDLSVLDAQERQRVQGFVHAKDRLRYAVAHTALRRILGACVGAPARDIVLVRETCPCCGGPHGRPALADAPFPLHFSLSHGGDRVLIGLATVAVGVDVEPEATPETSGELIPALHPAEQAELAAVPQERRGAAFTRLWARKEAYLKGIGTGLGRDLAADYLGTGGLAGSPPGWSVTDLPAGPKHFAACAALGAAHRTRVRHLSTPL